MSRICARSRFVAVSISGPPSLHSPWAVIDMAPLRTSNASNPMPPEEFAITIWPPRLKARGFSSPAIRNDAVTSGAKPRRSSFSSYCTCAARLLTRKWSEARSSSALLSCALKMGPRESNRSARSSPATGFQSAGKTGTRSASCGANTPAMNSAAMNGTRGAVSVVRAIRVVPGSTLRRTVSLGARSRRASRVSCRSAKCSTKSPASRSSLPLTVK